MNRFEFLYFFKNACVKTQAQQAAPAFLHMCYRESRVVVNRYSHCCASFLRLAD